MIDGRIIESALGAALVAGIVVGVVVVSAVLAFVAFIWPHVHVSVGWQ